MGQKSWSQKAFRSGPSRDGEGNARGDEGHEGHEEGVRSAREAARVLREDRQDGDRAEEDRLGEEQVGEDREQEGHPALQEGEGVPGLRTTCVSCLGGRGACSGLRELPAACLSDGRERRRSVRTRFGPEMSCTPMESLRKK